MKCNIARDLFPLYFDGLCSDETKELLEAHMAECDECRQLGKSLKEQEPFEENRDWEKTAAPLKKFKKKLQKKNFLLLLCTAALALFICAAVFLTYGEIAKRGVSFEMLYDALRFHHIGKQFAAGNIEPLYDILLDGYGLQDEESSVVRLAYTDRNAYASDMKKAVMEKYRRYFDGKELKYKGLEEIGYQETAKMGNARTLSAVLKFEGKDRIEYYLVLYKTLNGRYLAEDYFGDPYLSYTSYRESKEMDGGKAAKAKNGNGGAYHTDDTLFSCLPNRLSDLDMVLMRQMTLLSGQRALQGDKALAKAGQMRLPLISVQDLENGTHKLQESANAELAKLSGSGYYVTDLTWSVKEYDREKYLYRYRINMELTHETSLEKKIVTFDCYRIGDQFLYMEGTEEVYQ